MTGICSKHRGYDSDCDLCNVCTDRAGDGHRTAAVECGCPVPWAHRLAAARADARTTDTTEGEG